jgi:hypothetical protein
MALQLSVWPLPPFEVSWCYTQTVRLSERGISPSQGLYLHTEQHKHKINAHRHLCLELDSKPRSELPKERRHFIPQTARPLSSPNRTYRHRYFKGQITELLTIHVHSFFQYCWILWERSEFVVERQFQFKVQTDEIDGSVLSHIYMLINGVSMTAEQVSAFPTSLLVAMQPSCYRTLPPYHESV